MKEGKYRKAKKCLFPECLGNNKVCNYSITSLPACLKFCSFSFLKNGYSCAFSSVYGSKPELV